MDFNILFIFVEGDDDERFVKKVIEPLIKQNYSVIKFIKYEKSIKKEIIDQLNTIRNKDIYDYLFFCDFDSHGDANFCTTTRKIKEFEKYNQVLELEKIVVVKEVIESWYLAIADVSILNQFKLPIENNTEIIDKQIFNRKISEEYPGYRTYIKIELLKKFSIENGIKRNKSFEYFINKFTSYSPS
jgi:hypothetical protein